MTRTALTRFDAGEAELARHFLTEYSHSRSMNALALGQALADGIEARTRAIFGIRPPEQEVEGDHVHCY
ncbi:MAG: hypothetical protein ACXIUL_00030 [Wenzhouxiangella sp.]